MKLILSSTLLLLAFSASAQAQVPVPLAHGNMPGEPHHHLKIENEYVRAYYVEVPPHEATQLHQHDNDYIYVSLGPSDVMNAPLNKPEVHLQLKDGETHFTRGGFAHVARNLGDTPFRNVTIELLKPQGEPHNLCSQYLMSDPIGPCDKPVAGNHTLEPEFDTSEVSVDFLRFSQKTTVGETAMKTPVLVVAVWNSGIKIVAKDRPARVLHSGEMTWFDSGSNVQFSNDNGKSGAFLQITFIDALARGKP